MFWAMVSICLTICTVNRFDSEMIKNTPPAGVFLLSNITILQRKLVRLIRPPPEGVGKGEASRRDVPTGRPVFYVVVRHRLSRCIASEAFLTPNPEARAFGRRGLTGRIIPVTRRREGGLPTATYARDGVCCRTERRRKRSGWETGRIHVVPGQGFRGMSPESRREMPFIIRETGEA